MIKQSVWYWQNPAQMSPVLSSPYLTWGTWSGSGPVALAVFFFFLFLFCFIVRQSWAVFDGGPRSVSLEKTDNVELRDTLYHPPFGTSEASDCVSDCSGERKFTCLCVLCLCLSIEWGLSKHLCV